MARGVSKVPRDAANAVSAYLAALENGTAESKWPRGWSEQRVRDTIASQTERIESGELSPLERVKTLEARRRLQQILDAPEVEDLARGFIENVGVWNDHHQISYATWREVGVPASVLEAAGIKRTG